MRRNLTRRSLSLMMAVMMMASLLAVPAGAASEDSVVMTTSEITTETKTVSVTVTGCDVFKGGYIFLTTGPASNTDDADSRIQAGSVSFTGAGTYEIGVRENAVLKEGETLLVHLYRYNGETDRTMYKYGNAVEIKAGAPAPAVLEAAVEDSVNEKSRSIKVTVTGEIPAGARMLLKAYAAGEETALPKGKLVGSAEASADMTVTPAEGSLAAGERLVAFILSAGVIKAQSQPVTVKAAPAAEDKVVMTTEKITTETKTVSVTVTGCDAFKGGYIFLTTGPASNTDDADSRIQAGSVSFTGAGTYEIGIKESAVLKEGETLLVHLYRYNGETDRTMYKYGNAVEIKKAAAEPDVKPGTTPDEILANCKVTIMQNGAERTEAFRENETSADVKVQLDPGVEKCYLTMFSYASNTGFDPDSSQNIRLAGMFVKNGDQMKVDFNRSLLPLKVGYSVIACLNVPVGPDWYKPSSSQAIDIVDENGQSFEDYDPYPDAFVTEKTLEPGAEKLHISLRADQRLFEAAKKGQTSLNVAVAQYPNGDSFDFESADQISLKSIHGVTAPMDNQEIQLSEPLKAGYRVRAVVYWEQNTEIFLVKGNDYEAMFHRPDDSVLVSGEIVKPAPKVSIENNVKPSSKNIVINTEGEIPAGARLLVKAYAADANIVLSEGATVGAAAAAAHVTMAPAKDSLKTGEKLVAFILDKGAVKAQSQPVTVGKEAPPAAEGSVVVAGPISADSKSASVTVTGCEEFRGGYLIVTTGPEIRDDADSRTRLGSVAFTGAGTYTVSFNDTVLKQGETILAHLYIYDSVNDRTNFKYSEHVTIGGDAPAPEILAASIQGEVSTASEKITVKLTGPIPAGARVIVKAYGAGEKAELTGGTLIGSADAAASTVITVMKGSLKAGEKAVAFAADKGIVKAQSEAVEIKGEEAAPAVKVTLTDKVVTKGDTRVNASAEWDKKLGSSARYTLYQFTGEKLDINTAEKLSEGKVSSSYPYMIMNVQNNLKTGAKLQIVLTIGGKSYLSNIITVEPSPDWGTPSAAISGAFVSADAKSVSLHVEYDERYLTLGDAFYCDITLYQFPGNITDEEFLEKELWESSAEVIRAGQINSNWGDKTLGDITINIRDGVKLVPGSRLIAKLRLPHTEWEDAEVDYLSMSVPVMGAGEKLPVPVAALLNLDEDTARGQTLRRILNEIGIEVKTLLNKDLDETAGYVAGLPDYTETEGEYTDRQYDVEFMLLANLSEAKLDQLLKAMKDNGLFIGHKAMVVEGTKDLAVYEILDLIIDEHNETMRQALEKLVNKAEALDEKTYGGRADWQNMLDSAESAKNLLKNEKAATSDLEAAREELQKLYDSVVNGNTPEPQPEYPEGHKGTDSDNSMPSVKPADPAEDNIPFTDVNRGDYFFEAVKWAYENNIMEGVTGSVFNPDGSYTRAQMVTFLWRMAGSPKAENAELRFEDTDPDAYYAEAVIWASENGITKGTSENTFSPDAVCTRAQAVTFLYRMAQESAQGAGRFADVADDAYYAEAVIWASEKGITKGTSENTFSPDANCTRAEAVTFLYRASR